MNNASWPGLVARLFQQRKVAEVVATVDKYVLFETTPTNDVS